MYSKWVTGPVPNKMKNQYLITRSKQRLQIFLLLIKNETRIRFVKMNNLKTRTDSNNRVFHKTSTRTKPNAYKSTHVSFHRGIRLNQNRFNLAADSVHVVRKNKKNKGGFLNPLQQTIIFFFFFGIQYVTNSKMGDTTTALIKFTIHI